MARHNPDPLGHLAEMFGPYGPDAQSAATNAFLASDQNDLTMRCLELAAAAVNVLGTEPLVRLVGALPPTICDAHLLEVDVAKSLERFDFVLDRYHVSTRARLVHSLISDAIRETIAEAADLAKQPGAREPGPSYFVGSLMLAATAAAYEGRERAFPDELELRDEGWRLFRGLPDKRWNLPWGLDPAERLIIDGFSVSYIDNDRHFDAVASPDVQARRVAIGNSFRSDFAWLLFTRPRLGTYVVQAHKSERDKSVRLTPFRVDNPEGPDQISQEALRIVGDDIATHEVNYRKFQAALNDLTM